MPSLNVNNLEILATNQISTISGSTCNLDLLTYAVTVKELRTGGIFTASSVSSLPTASTSTGTLYFVDSERTIYFASTSSGWVPLVTGIVNNELWAWGDPSLSALRIGDGNFTARCSPVREFCSATDWCYVSLGRAIKTNGQLWTWGSNSVFLGGSGILGDGTTIARCSPVREFCSASDWCKVSSGPNTTAAIKTNGQLWTWGCNNSGILGIGDSSTLLKCSPVREFCSATDWCQVSSCSSIAAIKNNGQLWAWGSNNNGQLGIGNSVTLGRCSPVREFCSATDWCQVSVGNGFVSAIKTSGQLWLWGSNAFGRLGIGDASSITSSCSPVREFCSATDWCKVSNDNAVGAIKTNGQLWVWGWNFGSALGIGVSESTGRCSPIREFCSATDWCDVSVGFCNMSAIKTTGQLWSWGGNSFSALGDGTTVNRCSPVREFCSATDWYQVSTSYTMTYALKVKTIV